MVCRFVGARPGLSDREQVEGAVMRVAVAVIVSASILVACSNDPAPPSAPRTGWVDTACDTVACELASLDAGRPVAVDDPDLLEYEDELKRVSRWCRESESRIADYAIAAFQARAAAGILLGTLLTTLRNFPTRPGLPREKRDCSERFGRLG